MRGGRHFVYKQFQNENITNDSGQMRPKRPSSPPRLGARPAPPDKECPKSPKEGLLIDFSDDSSSVSSPSKAKMSSSRSQSGSLLDRSVSEYSQLPLPMGENIELEDPFEVRLPTLGTPLTPSKAALGTNMSAMSMSTHSEPPNFSPPPPCDGPPDFSPPPCPPRTYANLPCDTEENKGQKPLPSLPNTAPVGVKNWCSSTSSSESQTPRSPKYMHYPTSKSGEDAQTRSEERNPSMARSVARDSLGSCTTPSTADSLRSSSPFSPISPDIQRFTSSPRRLYGNVDNCSSGDNNSNPVSDPNSDCAFDWINSAIGEISVDNAKDLRSPKKATLLEQSLTVQSLGHANSSDNNNTVQYGNISDAGVRPKDPVSLQPRASPIPASWTQFNDDVSSLIPPVPPRQGRAAGPSSDKVSEPGADHFPRIHPIIKDGKQVSKTHYFLLMPRSNTPSKSIATVKPYRVTTPKKSHYKNLSEINPGLAMATNTHDTEHPELSTMVTLEASASAPAIYANTSTIVSSEHGDSSDSSHISAASASEKIKLVQHQVHGVTQQESQTVLANNNWDVHTAVCYLKVEQLFSIGIATHDRCRSLLEEYDWNLYKAADVLLNELSTGSAV